MIKPLAFDNNFMSLHCGSMGKLHHIVRLQEHKIDRRSGLVQVSELFGRPAIALQYPSKIMPSAKIKSNSKTGFYIKVDGKYFGVSFVSHSQDAANEYMISDDNSALIATDNDGFYYLATLTEIK